MSDLTEGTAECPMATHYNRVTSVDGVWTTTKVDRCNVSHVTGSYLPEPNPCAVADECVMSERCPHYSTCLLIDEEDETDE
jgi:hypothetical protein